MKPIWVVILYFWIEDHDRENNKINEDIASNLLFYFI